MENPLLRSCLAFHLNLYINISLLLFEAKLLTLCIDYLRITVWISIRIYQIS